MNRKLYAKSVAVCLLGFLGACSQDPQRLVEAGNRYHEKQKYQEASILYRKAIAKNKTFADAYYREGLNLLDQNNRVEAAKFFRRAIDLNPRNTDAEVKLSEIYLSAYAYDQKRFRTLLPEVKDLTAKILERDPRDFNGIRLQALLYLAEKDIPKALTTFEEANRIRPYSRDVVAWLAESLAAANRFEEAEKLCRDMIAHDKTWSPAYDFLFVQYMQRKKPQQAEAILREHVANDRASAVAVVNLSNYLLQTNRYNEAESEIRKVLSEPQQFPDGHRLVGDFYMRCGRFEQAVSEYRMAVANAKEDKLNQQIRLVGALARLGDKNPEKRKDALELARNIATEHPKEAAANELYGELLLSAGLKRDRQKSLADLKALVQKNNSDPVLHFSLARANFLSRDIDGALAEASEAVRLRPNLYAARLLMAQIYLDRGQYGKALDETGVVLGRAPNNPEARLVHARALIGLKDHDKAVQELEKLVNDQPRFNDAVYWLANMYSTRKDYAKAQPLFTKLWEGAGPDAQPDLRGFLGLQEIKLRQGNWQQAVASIEDLVQKNPQQPAIRSTLAGFETEAAQSLPRTDPQRTSLLKKAESNYQQVAETLKNSGEVWMKLGAIQRLLDENEAALRSFEKAAAAAPGNPDATLNRAMTLEALGQKDKAREAYTQAIGIDPDNVIALNNLAFLCADSNQNLDQAMTYAERAKKRFPNDANVADTLGYVYLKKNLTDNAIRELRTAVSSAPANAAYRLHLAMALLKQGDKASARKEAETALKTANSDQQEKIKGFLSQIG